MKTSKYFMIERQLVSRGIIDPRIINAFQDIDRDDFVETRYKKYAFYDIDIPLYEGKKFMLRPYTMAKVIEKILLIPHYTIMIVGDVSGFTSAIFKSVFEDSNCMTIDIGRFLELRAEFDVIFLDSKVYSEKILNESKDLLEEMGTMFFLKQLNKSETFRFEEENRIELELNSFTAGRF